MVSSRFICLSDSSSSLSRLFWFLQLVLGDSTGPLTLDVDRSG
jgi:hypothetical protein